MPPRPRHPHPPDFARLRDLPDWAVLSDELTCDIIGLSPNSLRQLDELGEGIPRTQLSARRHGRAVGNTKLWLKQRTDSGGPKDAA